MDLPLWPAHSAPSWATRLRPSGRTAAGNPYENAGPAAKQSLDLRREPRPQSGRRGQGSGQPNS
eukprot:11219727-Alexandrium_andersonii.AAC.1